MKPDRCPHCKRKMKRSNEANRRLWLIYHLMADKLRPQGQAYSAETWHVYMKQRYLGCDDVRMPNGKVIPIPRSTADLGTDKFNEYMYAVEAWANEHGVYLDEEIAA